MMIRAIFIILILSMFAACAVDTVKRGRDLFHGGDVDVKASQRAGQIVIRPGTEFTPFEGNGRSCASCHKARDNFGMSEDTRNGLAPQDLFFFPDLDEDDAKLLDDGLVHVIGDGLDEFRPTPALDDLCDTCDSYGNCNPLGLNSTRPGNLSAFTLGAIINHLAKSPARIAGEDFRPPTGAEIKALVDYQLSDDVCKGL